MKLKYLRCWNTSSITMALCHPGMQEPCIEILASSCDSYGHCQQLETWIHWCSDTMWRDMFVLWLDPVLPFHLFGINQLRGPMRAYWQIMKTNFRKCISKCPVNMSAIAQITESEWCILGSVCYATISSNNGLSPVRMTYFQLNPWEQIQWILINFKISSEK